MKKPVYITAILIFFCFAFWSCQKRPFATVRITGRVLNFWGKTPMPSDIQLWVGSSTPGSKGTTNYGDFSTNPDGTFDIKSNAQWNGDDYTLLIVPDGSQINCKVGNNKIIDVGDILIGSANITCKVTLNSVS